MLRPGRFDRQVVVGLPDIRGREQILKVHMRKVPIDERVNASVIARGTPGFSGADLANLVNEAALFAARGNRKLVTMEEFEKEYLKHQLDKHDWNISKTAETCEIDRRTIHRLIKRFNLSKEQ